MAFAHYEPDHRGVAALMRTAEMAQVVRTVAEDGMAFAQSIAPVATGNYRSKFRVETGQETIDGDLRAVARLVNDADYAADVEATHSVLRRTADHIGDD